MANDKHTNIYKFVTQEFGKSNIEGVEFTQPSGSSTSAALMSSSIAQQPIQTNSNINIGLDASMHAQINVSYTGQNTTSKKAKKDDSWIIIKKTQRFSIFILQDSLPGNNIITKKNFVYRKISDVLRLISLAPTSIKGIKVIQATYETEAQAAE
ncbi:hypothetical protein RhiirA5_443434, partial [Rhizophagus irregularis]